MTSLFLIFSRSVRGFIMCAVLVGGMLVLPQARVEAASVAIQSLNPGATVMANTRVTFLIVPTGFSAPTYHISDSFSPTTLSVSKIDPGGTLSWIPEKTDAGVHVITVTVTDNDAHTATVSQTITVLPPPSIALQNISPGKTIMPGTKLTAQVVPTGFTNPKYSISDSFGGSSAVNTSIDASGNFVWTPDVSQNGDHTITIYASDSLGHYSSANMVIRVGNGPVLTLSPVLPGASINVGQSVTFSAGALNFSPTAYSIADAFSGASTLTNNNITLTGAFSWTPQAADVGVHTVTVTGRIGAYGESASSAVTLTVMGPGGTLSVPAATTTTATSTNALSALQAQLAALQAKLGQAALPVQTQREPVFTLYLRPGSSGAEVTLLQNLLSEHGYFSTTPNGNFGPATTAAVKKFQTARGLDPLGVVGPATRVALNALAVDAQSTTSSGTATASSGTYVFEHFMGVGDDDPDVIELQKKLIALGYMSGTPTGYYGSATEKAVQKFQTSRGLPATGYVNSISRVELNK